MKNTLQKLPYSVLKGAKKVTAINTKHVELAKFFKRLVDTAENAPLIIRRIEKRLRAPGRVRQPVKISAIAKNSAVASGDKVALIVAKVLDDDDIIKLPSMKIVAFQWSKSVQAKIEANGGEIHTLDQFIKVSKSLDKLEFIATDPNHRKSAKYWGVSPGEKNSTTYPRKSSPRNREERRFNVKKVLKYVPKHEQEEDI